MGVLQIGLYYSGFWQKLQNRNWAELSFYWTDIPQNVSFLELYFNDKTTPQTLSANENIRSSLINKPLRETFLNIYILHYSLLCKLWFLKELIDL